ncbi:MAG: M28 family peptidase [Cyclobacteriaceae bacterium]|nr:M28 family peptidase [Cyclobacteriaceae bacterium]MCH8517555.1 M28 family peptidase [Cyclobacteriaceae bacterium]
MRSSILIIFCVLFFVLVGCERSEQSSYQSIEKPEESLLQVPSFSADSAFRYIEEQLAFGYRIPNTEGHRQAAVYLREKLAALGANVQIQEFTATAYTGEELSLKNIVGSYYPNASRRIMLAAHWDTRPFADKDDEDPDSPFMGANDGGSGVAVLLEIARILQMHDPGIGVDIMFFDGEDYGEPEGSKSDDDLDENIYWCLGSQYWEENPHIPNYSAYFGILLDMVGAKGAKFYREGYSRQAAGQVLNTIWKTAHRLGHDYYFINSDAPGILDDHIFMIRSGIPTVNIVDHDPDSEKGFFGKYHHTHDDNIDLIDRRTLNAVGETVLQVIFETGSPS